MVKAISGNKVRNPDRHFPCHQGFPETRQRREKCPSFILRGEARGNPHRKWRPGWRAFQFRVAFSTSNWNRVTNGQMDDLVVSIDKRR